MDLRMMASLDKVREALAKMPGASTDDFRTTVLGGKDLLKRKGIPFDAVAAVPRNDVAKDFCLRRLPQWTFRNNYATYGQT